MKRLAEVLAAAVLLGSMQAPLYAAQNQAIERAIGRGKTLYLYDTAAWMASDDLVARLPQDRHGEVGGWVVTSSGDGLHVDFFGKGQAADRVIYAVDIQGKTVRNATVYPVAQAPALKDPALAMAKALRSAWSEMSRRSDWQPCTNARFNTIVLPPERNGVIPVYFMTPQTETGSFPFGGHYEVDIARDGSVASARAFTRACITMAKPMESDGSVPDSLFITHLLDPHPTEIHVFEQFYVGLPLYVGTGSKTVWKVESGRIEDVSATMVR
jgi:hypothetical protein